MSDQKDCLASAQSVCDVSWRCNYAKQNPGTEVPRQAPADVINNCAYTLCSIDSVRQTVPDTAQCLTLLNNPAYSDCQRIIACTPGNFNPGGGPSN